VTEHGSFPGRPRGRRARQNNDVPEWQGYDATPQDQREFPDLAPIRPREARVRDGRAKGEWQGQQGQAAQQDGYGYPGPSAGGGFPQSGQQAPGGYDATGQYGTGYQGGQGPGSAQWPGQAPAQPEQAQPEQAQPKQPWPEQEWPGQVSQQPQQPWPGEVPWPGPQAAAGPQHQAPQHQAPQQVQQLPRRQDSPDEDVPSWAEPDSVEAFSARWHRRGLDSREERRVGRRQRRRLLIVAGSVLALLAAALGYLLSGGPGAANLGFGGFVTQFQQGELQQVPNPCTAVPAATLGKYLPGKIKQAAPPLNSGANTECTWTLDAAPTYRVLQVQLVAYSPSGLASGNGSATFAAQDAFESFQNGFTSPGPKSGQPKAAVKDLAGMPGGNDTSAFQATQVFNRGGATMDVANVLVRYRNVIITVVVDGLEQSGKGKDYGPVSMSDLTAAATTVGKEMAAKIVG
jgi:hypothetical protein